MSMLLTKYVGDTFVIMVTALNVFVTNIWYLHTNVLHRFQNITNKMSPVFCWRHFWANNLSRHYLDLWKIIQTLEVWKEQLCEDESDYWKCDWSFVLGKPVKNAQKYLPKIMTHQKRYFRWVISHDRPQAGNSGPVNVTDFLGRFWVPWPWWAYFHALFLLSFVRIFSAWKIVAIDSNWKMDIFMINKYRNYKLCNDEFSICLSKRLISQKWPACWILEPLCDHQNDQFWPCSGSRVMWTHLFESTFQRYIWIIRYEHICIWWNIILYLPSVWSHIYSIFPRW